MGEIADALRKADSEESPHGGPPSESVGRPPGDVHRSVLRNAHPASPTEAPPIPLEASGPPAPDDRVRSPELPVEALARAAEKTNPAQACLRDPRDHCSQQYRRLAIRLRGMAEARQVRSIVITSAQAGEGKTTTACNLAVAMAMTDRDRRVVLVDLDLHRASIAAALQIDVAIPIEAILRGESTLDEASMETDVDGLFVLANNSPAADSESLLANRRFVELLARLKSRFDWIIIDTPPVLATSDTQMILQHADSALVVARAGLSHVSAVREAIDHISQKQILASFLNSSSTKSQQPGYYEYDRGDHGAPASAAPTGSEEEKQADDDES